MDKRTETISSRITPELLHQAQQIALARDITLSDLVFQQLEALAEAERARYLKLRQAFECSPDLPGGLGYIDDAPTGKTGDA